MRHYKIHIYRIKIDNYIFQYKNRKHPYKNKNLKLETYW